MNKINIFISSLLIISALTIATAITDNTSTGTTSGVTLVEPTNTIKLCTKVIPSSGNWGSCEGRITTGTFTYETSGPTLRFNAEAHNLDGGSIEVSNLRVIGITTSTITWAWTTPNRDNFTGNTIEVRATSSGLLLPGYPKTISAIRNQDKEHLVSGLQNGVSYTITVKSEYSIEPTVYEDTMYSLIYYRDSDINHHNATTLEVIKLGENTSLNGIVTFSGIRNTSGENIPVYPDVNSLGKIWILPTSRINNGFIDWTGYTTGYTMPNFLFEEDISTTVSGGISYTYTVSP